LRKSPLPVWPVRTLRHVAGDASEATQAGGMLGLL
jgi:hypothetical protein